MKAVLAWVLVALATAVVVAGALVAAYVLDWPLWTVGLLVVGVLGVAALGVILSRRRGGRDVGDAEASAPATEPSEASRAEAAQRRRALDARWRAFLGQLRRSKVRGKGDPIYALPWYLMLGEDGAGKTAAARNSLLALPSAEAADEGAGEGGLGWHILEEALVLEAPAHYALPATAADEAEWVEFLARVARARSQEPLNGVIVAVPADALAREAQEVLKARAVALGKRIDEIARRLGAVVPVYLLVTKCDLIGGMTKFFGYLPEAAVAGAMGGLNDEPVLDRPRETFLEDLFGRLYEDLRQLRLTVLGDVPPDEVHPQTVPFPEEFLQLKEPLGRFAEVLLERNPYREPPFFRGVYFASARQQGVPASECLKRLGLQDETLPLAGEGKSLFLKGFFGQVLPNDRGLVAPTARALGWRHLTRNAALAGWVLLCVALGVLLSVSFGRNLTAIRQADRQVPARPYLGPEFGPNLRLTQDLRAAVLGAYQRQQEWVLPRFGLDHDEELAAGMAGAYVARFRGGVLDPLDKELDRELLAVSDGADPSRVARCVDYLSKRTGLLQLAAEGGVTEAALAKAAQPDFELVLRGSLKQEAESFAGTVQEGYRSYLAWSDDPAGIRGELETEQARLANLLSQKAIGFAWLTEWANLQQSIAPVTLAQYWAAEAPPQEAGVVEVERAYTPPGWQAISDFIATVSRSVSGGEGIGAALNAFETSYRNEYLAQWERFLREFHRGSAGWVGRQRRVDLAGRLAGPASPYARLLADCPAGLAPALGLARDLEDVPEWVSLLYRYERLSDPAYQKALKGADGVVGRLASRGGQLLADLKARLRDQPSEANVLEQDTKALSFLTAYQETLQQMAASAQTPAASFQATREAYVEAETSVGEPQQPVSRNLWTQVRLSGVLSHGRPRGEIFWQLLSEPVAEVWGVLLDESQVYLQQKWEEEVLAEGKNLAGWDFVDALQGDAGKIWTFQNQYLEAFLTKEPRRGYVPKRLYNDALDLPSAFLRIANLGKLGGRAFDRSYRVQVAALPTSANPGATVQPHRTQLVLQCGTENQDLVNLNYPIAKTFNWNPRECSDVVLEIAVGDAVLVKRYPGYDGFLKFLRDFQSGSRLFRPDEFPAEHTRALGAYQVKNITVSYGFKGHGDALRLAQYDPAAIPSRLFE